MLALQAGIFLFSLRFLVLQKVVASKIIGTQARRQMAVVLFDHHHAGAKTMYILNWS